MAHEFLLYGSIFPDEVRDYGIRSGVTDKEVAMFLNKAGGDPVKFRCNSRGGDADAGFAMKALIDDYPGRTEFCVDGMAASAATIVAMGKGKGGGKTTIASNGGFMVHKSMVLILGYMNSDELREIARINDTYDTRMASAYAARTKLSQQEWLEKIIGDTYLTSGDAKDLGLVDEVTGDVEVRMDQPTSPTNKEAKDPEASIAAHIAPIFEKAPEWFKNRLNLHQEILWPKDAIEARENKQKEITALLERTDRIGKLLDPVS